MGHSNKQETRKDRVMDEEIQQINTELAMMRKDTASHQQSKPPAGIKPKKIHDQHRSIELIDAIRRYVNSDHKVPREWVVELYKLLDIK